MEPEFITYRKFDDIALANELTGILSENNIPFLVEEEAPVFDPSFSFKPLGQTYAVKIQSSDFERVAELMLAYESASIDDVDKDYYLFDFSDEELMDVISKADEWSAFDNLLARKILAERGKPVSDKEIEMLKEQRIEELKVPDAPQTQWIVLGYIFAFLGGIPGLFIGWYISTYKKTLPNGEKVYGYSESDRKQGRIIFYIAILVISICVVGKFVIAYNS